MFRNIVLIAAVGILLLLARASFAQPGEPLAIAKIPVDGTTYTFASESSSVPAQARAYKWYSPDRKTYLLLIATITENKDERRLQDRDAGKEVLLQVGEASRELLLPTTTLRLGSMKQIRGLLSTLKYERDAVQNIREKGISYSGVNDCLDSDDRVQSVIGASVLENGATYATIDLKSRTGSCIFTFAPKEQYLDFVAKYEALSVWLEQK